MISRILRYLIYTTITFSIWLNDLNHKTQVLASSENKRKLSAHKYPSLEMTSSQNILKSKNWGLSGIHLIRSKNISHEKKNVVVAVIDTGIDYTHRSLSQAIWTNPGEMGLDENGLDKSSNGVDDDMNGYIDDIRGWNFVKNNNNISDNHGHGTHISGIIAAHNDLSGNPIGISPKTKVMVLKYFDPFDPGISNLDNTIKAIDYAIDMGADIINYSSGGLQPSQKEREAIKRASDKGILFISAAGNEKSNLDVQGYYPADYGLPNIISVTAIDKNSKVLDSSNFGMNKVDIAAPGNEIWSTLPHGGFGEMTGTSQATGFVSGLAALLLHMGFPRKNFHQLKRHLILTGQEEPNLKNKTIYRVKLNAERALMMRGIESAFNDEPFETSIMNSTLQETPLVEIDL